MYKILHLGMLLGLLLGLLLLSGCLQASENLEVTSSETNNQLAPSLGTPISEGHAQLASFTILADGTGLPDGSGTVSQGKTLYQQHCLACHGVEGKNGINDQLVGGQGTLTSSRPVRTIGSYWPYATTIFDFIRRAMPYQNPGSLSHNDVYALTAYLLYLNEIVPKSTELTATNLVDIKMPNEKNFVQHYPNANNSN